MFSCPIKTVAAGAALGLSIVTLRQYFATYKAATAAKKSAKPAAAAAAAPTAAIHHYVLWKFKGGTPAATIDAAVVAADAIQGAVPGVISSKVTLLTNTASAKGFTHQYLVVLGSTAALAGFDSSAAHKALMEDHIKPIIEDTLIYDVESTTTGKLSGKAALITGSSSGIGKAVALAYAREGCDVVINYPPGNDADGANAREVAAEVELLGRKAFVAAADITVESEVATMVEQTLGEFGKIDILVNNAGIASASPVESMPPEMWDTMIKVNTRGMYLCTRAVLPHMYKRDSGRIINTASQLAYKGAPAFSHYCATKGAILSFTRSVALEIGTRRVRINAVGPGATMTPILAGVPDDVLNGIKAAIPRGKIAEVSEIAPTYVFLASDESDAYVGQCLSPNGGDAFL